MDVESRLDRLEEVLTRLAEAQARTEARLGELAKAQEDLTRSHEDLKRSHQDLVRSHQELVQAQARTEARVLVLARQVGRLGEAVGFGLEGLARDLTPPYLAQHRGIHVARLDRRFFTLDGQEIEVDLYGEGRRDGEPVALVGEVKSRIYGRDVERACQRADRLIPQLPGPPVVVLFGFVVHPSAGPAADRLGAIVISAFGRP